MRIKWLMVFTLMLFLVGGTTEVYSQSWLKKLGKKVEEKAKQKVEEKAEKTVDKAFDKAEKAAGDAVKSDGKDKTTKNAGANAVAQTVQNEQPAVNPDDLKSVEMAWNKFDFVAGDEVMFDDPLAGERLGEFPSQWDLKSGYAEVMQIAGTNAIYMTEATMIMPFMKEKHYLPDVFTIELDIYIPRGTQPVNKIGMNSRYNLNLVGTEDKNVFQLSWYHGGWDDSKPTGVRWEWHSGGERSNGEQNYTFKYNDFNRISISFNKRAMKVYLNETRVGSVLTGLSNQLTGRKNWRVLSPK